jgi:hypothetical protein
MKRTPGKEVLDGIYYKKKRQATYHSPLILSLMSELTIAG